MRNFPSGSRFAVGPQGTHIAAGTGFREAHRAAHSPAKHFIHILVFQLFRPVMHNQSSRTVGQTGIHQEGKVCA